MHDAGVHLPWSRAACAALVIAASVVAAGCSAGHDACGGGSACTRVLFIGNSYTYTNDLPGTFVQLAQAGGHPVSTDSVAEGGATLADANTSDATASKLAATTWGFVVLQEQSEIPSMAGSRDQVMYPAARSLVARIKAVGATPVFFMTWAHEAGWPENGLPDYLSMQRQIDAAYVTIAQQLGVPPEAPGRLSPGPPCTGPIPSWRCGPTMAAIRRRPVRTWPRVSSSPHLQPEPERHRLDRRALHPGRDQLQAAATTSVEKPAQAWLSP